MSCRGTGGAAAGGAAPRPRSLSRRRLLGAGGLALAAGVARPAAAAKISKAAAKYQDKPHGEQRCEICLQFRPPHQCQLVEGTISPTGWCQFFAAKENAR